MKLTQDQLADAAGISTESARLWLAPVNAAGVAAVLNSPSRWAMWIAQCGHESGGFTRLVENLNYTPEGLMQTWPNRFSVELAQLMGRTATKAADQKAIANHVYGGRLGNRPGTDDGYRYRGRGLLQVTFRANYMACGKHIDVDIEMDPDILGTDRRIACESTAWYWDSRAINGHSDVGDVDGATKKINGGHHGLADRKKRYGRALSALGGSAADELARILGK